MRRFYTIFVILILLLPQILFGQYFGKNKVQYENFHWQFLQSEHFDIYFTDGGDEIAEFAAEVAEKSYIELSKDLRFELTDRITLLVHNSHNDFGQTNVTLSPAEESVGGFTEFFKNRVVVPYEGEWEKFRHVIHHELTHAVMLQMVYGAGVQSIITGMARLRMPLWLIEGLAEYESRGWDTESDMYIRDATLNGYLPPVDYLYGFMAYKGGQSVLYYLSEKYGGQKIGELLGKIKVTKSMKRGLKQAVGADTEELTKKWHMHLKREYWPDIADRKEPEEIAKRLTDHTKWKNFVNSGPALSPKGDKIAFLSDKSGYFDIYLMSAIDGKIISKLVSGQQTANLEELHWLRAGISWSPNSKYIVFAAKSGAEDALHIVNVRKKKIVNEYKLALDGIFTPSWSPKGEEIAFMGIQKGQGDIYSFNIKTKKLRQITNDVYSDIQPQWSVDGKKIAFVSDRGNNYKENNSNSNVKIYDKDFYQKDVYLIDVETEKIQRITNTKALEASPVFAPDGVHLAYTSDDCGINNIYLYNLKSGINYPITNVITGVFNLSWHGDNKKLAFTSFYSAGYDVYLLRNPLDIAPGEISLQKTNFIKKNPDTRRYKIPTIAKTNNTKIDKKSETNVFRNFVFDDNFKKGKIDIDESEKNVFLDSTKFKSTTGDYKVNKYKIKFSPDIIQGSAGYSQFFGVQGMTQIALSDVLGNHRINIYTNLFYDLKNSNYQLSYFYLPRQTDYGFGAFHYSYYFYLGGYVGWARDRNYGANLFISHPFSKYKRVNGSLSWIGIERDYIQSQYIPNMSRNLLLANVSLINDTVLWGITGPVNGNRYSVDFRYSPGLWLGNNGINFTTLKMDYRKYFQIGKDYNFVVRLAGGLSEGEKPQQFFLGGTSGWLNYRTKNGLRVSNLEDIYFSTFELPMRGAYYYERVGNRFVLNNLEFRFPLIKYFILGWPLPIGFQNIRGAMFTDVGAAWYDDNFRGIDATGRGKPALQDLFLGYGFGARMNLGFLLLRFDVAWSSDLANSTNGPYYYFSLGPEF